MFQFLLVVQIITSVSIIVLVMLQQGKGADMGAGFGAGASGTVFGARGSGSFFTRATGILAAIFFINCLLIASPLIRDQGSTEADTLAEQLEQQATQQREAEQTNAVIDALESQEAAEQGAPAEITESVMTDSDLPDVPADEVEVPAAPATDDLPE